MFGLRLPASLRLNHPHRLTCAALPSTRRRNKLIPSRLIASQTRTVAVPNSRLFFTSSSIMHAFSSDVCQGAGTLDDAITRSKSSLDVQTATLDPNLPEVARIPSRKRTFHLNHEDLETHVRPLLSCHWHVGHVGDVVGDLQVLSLGKLFSFKTFRSAIQFFDALADVQDEDDHHARITVDYANVYVSTHTHVAYQRPLDADPEVQPMRVPGLTLRDVRFAVKVERLHEKFLNDERAVTKVPVDSGSLMTWSMEQLRRRYPALA